MDTESHPPTKLLTADQVVEILNVSKQHVYKLMQKGLIRKVNIGRSVRVRPEDLNRYIQEHTSK